ncbi:MAG: hypothetical protein H6671_03720 [Anaerolineaceae bacterium]|nr:hypothetical protein [Anaerolineaceae bacterium]
MTTPESGLGARMTQFPDRCGCPGNGTINGRSGPGTDYPVVDSIENITNRCLVVTGRNEDNSWIRLRNPFSSVETVGICASAQGAGDLTDVEVADE